MSIHEIRDRLSSMLARLAAPGEVENTKHGLVVAFLVPPRPTGVLLRLGARPGGQTPNVEDLRWSDDELHELINGSIYPA